MLEWLFFCSFCLELNVLVFFFDFGDDFIASI